MEAAKSGLVSQRNLLGDSDPSPLRADSSSITHSTQALTQLSLL